MALALVLLWTARLARSKSRNPWLWGGATFILMLTSMLGSNLNLLAVIPLIILMFVKSPQPQSNTPVKPQTCPKCETASIQNSRFCTSCGWEMASPYSSNIPADQEEPTSLPTEEERQLASAGDASSQESGDQEVPAPAQATASETAPEPAPEASLPEPVAPPKPVSLDAPTAAGMTERGVRLYKSRARPRVDRPIHQGDRLGPQLHPSVGTAGRGLCPPGPGR